MKTIRIGEEELPAVWEICPRCKGEGVHINPSIDGDGISGDDECWQDEDFTEMYFNHGYDVTCEECNGAGKVLVPDIITMSKEQLDYWYEWQADEAEYRHIQAMERRFGA